MNIKKILKQIGLTFFLIGFVLTSCTQSPQKSSQQTLRLNLGTEPPSLDPRQAIDLTSGIVLKMLYDGLTRMATNGKTKPSVAKTITVSEDLKTYTFKLRDSLWSNGDPVTAHDFSYAWKWILDPKNDARYAYQLYVIKNAKAAKEGKISLDDVGIHVIDDSTLIVELEYPTPYFLELTSMMMYYPVNKKSAVKGAANDGKPADQYISNGPFQLISWRHNNELTLEKNKLYWDASSVRLDEIRLFVINDATTELHLFESGELDWAGTPLSVGLPNDAILSLKESGNLHIKPEAATYFYEFNTEKFPLNNKKLRKALAYAINRKAIVENITQANQIPATSFLPPLLALQGTPYFPDADIQTAQKLLKEALSELGLTLEDLPKITISYNTSENHHKIAQAVQQQINQALGIKIELNNLEWKVYLDALSGHNFDIGRLSWIADFNDPITFLQIFKYKSNSTNSTGWENPEYIALLDESSREPNRKKRLALLQKAETILMDEMPIIPIYFIMNSYLKNPKLQNVYLSGLGDIDFKWAYFE
jgi:oligopeptide transport system substrate-binding protein